MLGFLQHCACVHAPAFWQVLLRRTLLIVTQQLDPPVCVSPSCCNECCCCAWQQLSPSPACLLAAGTVPLRQALLIGFANCLAGRMPSHNGYKTLGDNSTLAQLHPSCARLDPDEDGLLPPWVVYHELVATQKTFLSKVGKGSCLEAVQLCSTGCLVTVQMSLPLQGRLSCRGGGCYLAVGKGRVDWIRLCVCLQSTWRRRQATAGRGLWVKASFVQLGGCP